MRKEIFLEYKFGDYDSGRLRSSGANGVVAWMERLNTDRWKQLRGLQVRISLCFSASEDDVCPLDPTTKEELAILLQKAADYKPDGIILDHFRFRGRWEQKEEELKYVLAHKPCAYCRDVDKGAGLVELAGWIRAKVPSPIELGYYAAPVGYEKFPQFGQNHKLLTEIFDYSSPMLYHRMLGKPVEYIHTFVEHLADLCRKPVIPAIAVKDMPDDLADEIDETILRQEYYQASLPPSAGVCWFSWDGAVEKQKNEIIAKIWK